MIEAGITEKRDLECCRLELCVDRREVPWDDEVTGSLFLLAHGEPVSVVGMRFSIPYASAGASEVIERRGRENFTLLPRMRLQVAYVLPARRDMAYLQPRFVCARVTLQDQQTWELRAPVHVVPPIRLQRAIGTLAELTGTSLAHCIRRTWATASSSWSPTRLNPAASTACRSLGSATAPSLTAKCCST